MNARLVFLFLLSFASSVIAAPAGRGYVAMKIIQTAEVQYPRDVSALGVISGDAHVAIQVDSKGQLTDVLVVGYSHK